MSTAATFRDVQVGEAFTIHGVKAKKLDGSRYEILSGGRIGTVRHTTANASVNGLSSMEKQRRKNQQKWRALNELAQSIGYSSWSVLGKAALEGVRIVLN